MDLSFDGTVWHWRGPAPWYFVTVPAELSEALSSNAAHVSYGWGVLPVIARIGRTTWRTSLIPKDGRFLVPLKVSVRDAEGIDLDDVVSVHLHVAT